MQSPQTTVAEYLRLEEHAETKHEYWDGEVIAMAGTSWEPVVVTGNVFTVLRNQLHGRCTPVQSDMRVRLSPTRYAYPDVVVVCGKPELTGERPPSLLNPVLIVEVTSESTMRVDKGYKLKAYREITSLQEYWILDYEERMALQYVKGNDWNLRIHDLESTIQSTPLGVEMPLSEIFAV